MYKTKPKGWAKHWDFILLDLVIIQISFVLAFVLRYGPSNPYKSELYRSLAIVFLLSDLFVSAIFNTFSKVLKYGYYKTFIAVVKHIGLVILVVILYTFTTQTGLYYSRLFIINISVMYIVLGYCGRLVFRRIRRKFLVNKKRNIFLISYRNDFEPTVSNILLDVGRDMIVKEAAILDINLSGTSINGISIVANADTLIEYLCHSWVDGVYIKIPRSDERFYGIYKKLMEMGITVHLDIGDLTPYNFYGKELETIGGNNVITSCIKTISFSASAIKRLFDIFTGVLGSLFAIIFIGVFAIPIKLKSPGPILYKSERIGLNGKRFKMYKIRTMRNDAESLKASLSNQNKMKDGMMFKIEWDPRVIGNEIRQDGSRKTGIGDFLRKTSIDEFPQFFNVLGGSMSLVGTRPPTPDEWIKYGAHHRARLATKPGITGLWQVSGRSEITDFEQIVKLDTEYITNWSFGVDIKIILKTIVTIINRKGAM